jgi:hypothetical protein
MLFHKNKKKTQIQIQIKIKIKKGMLVLTLPRILRSLMATFLLLLIIVSYC